MTDSRATVLGLLLASLVAAAGARAGADLVIRVDEARTGTGAHVAPAEIVIRGGRIVSVSPPRPHRDPELAFLDATGGVAIPGLVDARSGAGLPAHANEEATEVSPALRAIDLVDPSAAAFEAALRSGVTTAAVSPRGRAVIGGLVGALKTDRGRSLDQRLVRSDAGLLITLGYEPPMGNRISRFGRPRGLHFRRPGNRMGLVAEVRRQFHAARTAGEDAGPGARVLQAALAGELPVFFRARTESDLRTALRLATANGLSAVLVEPVEGHRLADTLAAAGHPAVVGPFYHLPRHLLEFWEGQDVRHANASLLADAGVRVAIGSGPDDSPARLRELAVLARRHGLSAEEALAAVTNVPAEVLRIDDRVGRLAPGLDGDVVITSGDPLSLDSGVLVVVVEGRVVHRHPSVPLEPGAATAAPDLHAHLR